MTAHVCPTWPEGTMPRGVGLGGVGVAGRPSQTRKRPDLCAEHDHPGVTYNPWQDRTWCLCGEVVRDGDQVARPHMACCGGPLEDVIHHEDCRERAR